MPEETADGWGPTEEAPEETTEETTEEAPEKKSAIILTCPETQHMIIGWLVENHERKQGDWYLPEIMVVDVVCDTSASLSHSGLTMIDPQSFSIDLRSMTTDEMDNCCAGVRLNCIFL
jgi:hypothetical protein